VAAVAVVIVESPYRNQHESSDGDAVAISGERERKTAAGSC